MLTTITSAIAVARTPAGCRRVHFSKSSRLVGGFALIAAPAVYRNTGVKTFLVSHDGVVYEKDLGPKTLEAFQSIDRFNPDKTWTPVKAADEP